MQIETLSALLNLTAKQVRPDDAVVTFDGAGNVTGIMGRATVLGMPNQGVGVSFSVVDGRVVAKPRVVLSSVTLPQLAALGVLPVSAYRNDALPAVTFTDVSIEALPGNGLLTFKGKGPGGNLPLGINTLPVSDTTLHLSVRVEGDNTAVNREAYIGGTLRVGAGLPVRVELPRGAADWLLHSVGEHSSSLSGGLADLTALAGQTISTLLPATMPGLDSFALSGVAVSFDTATPQVSGVNFSIASAGAWRIITNVLELKGFTLNLSCTRWESALAVAGSIEGVIKLFDVEVAVGIPLPPGSGTWLLTSYPNVSIPGVGDLVNSLSNLIGAGDLRASMPAGLDTLGNLRVEFVEIGIDPTQQTPARLLQSVAFRLTTQADWALPYAPSIKLADAYIDLQIAYPLDAGERRVVTGALGGVVHLGSVSIPVLIERTTAVSNWTLRIIYGGISVGLPDLLTLAGADAAAFRSALPSGLSVVNDLALTSLEVDYDLTANALSYASFTVDLTDPWVVVEDFLTFNELGLSAECIRVNADNSWQYLTRLSAQVEIMSVGFILTAGNTGAGGVWTFTGAMSAGYTLKLSDLIKWLQRKLLGAEFHLPESFPEISVTAAEVAVTPSTGAFAAQLTSSVTWNIPFAQSAFKINKLTTALDIGAAPAAQEPRPYTFEADGDFQFNSVVGRASFKTGGAGPTVIRVEVAASEQLSAQAMVDALVGGGGGAPSPWDNLPAPGDFTKPSHFVSAGMEIDLTAGRFLMHGDFTLPGADAKADMYGTAALLVARQPAAGGGEATQYAYAVGAALKNWSFSKISTALGVIEDVLSVKQAGAFVLLSQLEGEDVSALSAHLPAVGAKTGNKRGLSFYAELDFKTGLLLQVAQLLGITVQGPFTVGGHIPADSSQSEFKATLGSLTLLGLLSFKNITLIYKAREATTYIVNGKLVVHLNKDYTFDGDVMVVKSMEGAREVTRAMARIESAQSIERPLNIPRLSFSKLFFEFHYVFDGAQSDTQFALGGSVAFTEAVSLGGLIYFKQGSPAVVLIQISTLKLDDLFSAVIGSGWPTGLLDISFKNGMLYYAPADVSLVKYEPATGTTKALSFEAGFHASTDIDIFFIKDFHVEATIQNQGITISGGYQSPVDWGFIKFYRGPVGALPSDLTKGPLVSVASATNTFTLTGGFALFDTAVAGLSINVRRETMSGRLELEREVGPFGRPAFDFVWDAKGFRVTNWPLGKVKLPDFDFTNISLSGNCPVSGILKIPIKSKLNITPDLNVTLEPVPSSEQKRPTLTVTLKGSLDLVVGSSAYPETILSAPIGNARLSVPLTDKGFTWNMLADSFVDCLKSAAAGIFETLIRDPRNLAKLLAVEGVEWGFNAVKDFLMCEGASLAEATAFVEGASGAVPVGVGILGFGGILVGGVLSTLSPDGSHYTNHDSGGGDHQTRPRPSKPAAPSLSYADGKLNVNWVVAANAERYVVVLTRDGAHFTQTAPTNGTSANVTAQGGHTYGARVVATGPGGTSDAGDTATLNVLGKVSISRLAFEAGEVSVAWTSGVNGARQYSVQLLGANRDPFGFDSTVNADTGGRPTLSAKFVLPPPPDGLPAGAIYARVRALTDAAQTASGEWSVSSDSLTKLATPVIASLSYTEGKVTAALRQIVAGASLYEAYFGNAGPRDREQTVATTPAVATLRDAKVRGGDYGVRVRALGSGDKVIPSDWGESTGTVAVAGTVRLISLGYGDGRLRATWSPSPSVSRYEFELRGGASPLLVPVQTQRNVGRQPIEHELPTEGMRRDVRYKARVRGTTEAGAGAWSEEKTFEILDAPTGLTATYEVGRVLCSWHPVSGADGFVVSLNTPGPPSPREVSTPPTQAGAPPTNLSIDVSDLQLGSTATVSVKAVAGQIKSPPSAAEVVMLAPPVEPHLVVKKGQLLRVGEYLRENQCLVSANGLFHALMQADGNFCIYYGPGPEDRHGFVWGTQQRGDGGQFFALMQADGNFSVSKGTEPSHNLGHIWDTRVTSDGGQFFAVMQDDGNFCVYKGTDPSHTSGLIWESGSNMKRLLLDQDQSQYTSYLIGGGNGHWQSFTAGRSGLLKQIDISATSTLRGQPMGVSIAFYEGEGVVPDKFLTRELMTFQFGDDLGKTFHSLQLAAPFPVLSGRRYTIWCDTNPAMGSFGVGPASAYTRGRFWPLPDYAMRFRTHVLVV
jgi:hypothetical protein